MDKNNIAELMSSITSCAKDAICGPCEARQCCCSTDLPLTAADVRRIVTTMQLPPQRFIEVVQSADGFIMTPGSSSRVILRLRRRKLPRKRGGGCVCLFLLVLDAEIRRCGLGKVSPVACRLYPARLSNEQVILSPDRGCVKEWDPDEATLLMEPGLIATAKRETDEHKEFMARWNALVSSKDPEERARFEVSELLAALVSTPTAVCIATAPMREAGDD